MSTSDNQNSDNPIQQPKITYPQGLRVPTAGVATNPQSGSVPRRTRQPVPTRTGGGCGSCSKKKSVTPSQ